MTTITIEQSLIEQAIESFVGYRREMRLMIGDEESEPCDAEKALCAALAAPESGAMAEIDYTDDDALRFIQRVLESDAPGADKKAARDMVVEIRTRVLKARASKPATAPDLSDAYAGAREDLKIWKKRALEAEETVRQLNRALAEEVDGPTFMGEPVLPATAPATTSIEDHTLERLLDAWDTTVLPKHRDGAMQEWMEALRHEFTTCPDRSITGRVTDMNSGLDPDTETDDRHAQELLAQDITIANMRERHAQELCAYQITVDKLKAERKPMGTAERVRAFQAEPDPVSYEDFIRGIDAAEAHHGIGEQS